MTQQDRVFLYGCILFLVLTMLMIVSSCASLTPAQRTLWALNVYENQYNSYLEQILSVGITADQREQLKKEPSLIGPDDINPSLSEGQKKVLRVKRQILIELKPLVLMAGQYQLSGQLPSDDVLRQLTDLINRLVVLAEED